jgi:hypothetical protein
MQLRPWIPHHWRAADGEGRGTLELDRASFPSSGPVRVALELPVAPADAEPRPVQVFSEGDNRVFDTQGRLDSERSAATIDLDPSFLRPGTISCRVKTPSAASCRCGVM